MKYTVRATKERIALAMIVNDDLKVCAKCGNAKPRSLFYRDRSKADGLKAACKACDSAHEKATAESRRERKRETNRALYAKKIDSERARRRRDYRNNIDAIRDRNRAYREAHREELLAYFRRYNATDKHREGNRSYYQRNREQVKERNRVYGRLNVKRKIEYNRRWRADNPDLVRAHARSKRLRNPAAYQARKARRSARAKASGSFTAAEWRALCDWFGNVCVKCGATGKLSPDHVLPLAKGGSNMIFNIQPLCWPCNHRKHIDDTDYRDRERLNAFLESIDEIED